MARIAQEKLASDLTTSISNYDSTKWNLGDLIKKRTDIGTTFIGPIVNTVGRPLESPNVLAAAAYPWAMQWSPNIDWIFFSDGAAAGATRKLQMWEFDRNMGTLTSRGYTTFTFPTIGSHLITGFRMIYDAYTTGQVTVNASTVTGYQSSVDSSASWVTHGICASSRIGFGTTVPHEVSIWYQIKNVVGNTTLALCTQAPTISTSTNYVIEDLRAVMYNVNSTTVALGGLFVAKGLSYYDFPVNSSTLCSSINAPLDNVRGVYYLPDIALGGTVATDVSAAGFALEPMRDWRTQYVYTLGLAATAAGTTAQFRRYNVRAPLTVTSGSGRSFNAIDFSTGSFAITATLSRTNNGRFAKLGHGPLADASAIYFASTTKVYGVPITQITPNTASISPATMAEVPPGGTNTFALTNALASVEHSSTMDVLLVMTTGATAFRSYVTKFKTTGNQFDHVWLADTKMIDQVASETGNTTPFPNTLSVAPLVWVENGLLYVVSTGTTAATNMIHTAPVGVEWTYSSSTNTVGRLITPKFVTPNCNKYVRVYAVRDNMLGTDILGKRTDAIRISYRTAGIDDNTGVWNLLVEPNDLGGVAGATAIQFMIEFKGITDFCIPARVMVVGVIYDDNTTDSHFQPSVKNSDVTNKYFAWRYSSAFSTAVPPLTVSLVDAVSGAVLVTDHTNAATLGTFKKSTNDGGAWTAYDTADRTNETTYIRYDVSSLADNIKIKASLILR